MRYLFTGKGKENPLLKVADSYLFTAKDISLMSLLISSISILLPKKIKKNAES